MRQLQPTTEALPFPEHRQTQVVTIARRRVLGVILLASGFLLNACGGGASSGSDGSGGSVNGNNNNSTYAAISGVVLDGYLHGATVFLDKNGNNQWDDGEPKTTSDANGKYNFNVLLDDTSQKYRVVARTQIGITVDSDNPDYVLQAEYVLRSSQYNTSIISPFSTLIAAEESAWQSPPQLLYTTQRVKEKLGLSADANVDLLSDYGNASEVAKNPNLNILRNHAQLIVGVLNESIATDSSENNIKNALNNIHTQYQNKIAPHQATLNVATPVSSATKIDLIVSLAPTVAARQPLVVAGTSVMPVNYQDNRTGNNSTDNSSTDNSSTDNSSTNNSSTNNSSTNNSSTNNNSTTTNYSIKGRSSGLFDSSNIYYLYDNTTQAALINVTWQVAGLSSTPYTLTKVTSTSTSTTVPEYARLELPTPSNNPTTSLIATLTASYNGQSWSKTVTFNPSFRYTDPAPTLPLSHEHYSTSTPARGSGLAWWSGSGVVYSDASYQSNPAVLNSYLSMYGFDSNGWLNAQYRLSLPNNLLAQYGINTSGNTQFSVSDGGNVRYFIFGAKADNSNSGSGAEHSRLLFIKADVASNAVSYVEITPPDTYTPPIPTGSSSQKTGPMLGVWQIAHYGSYFIAIRSGFTSTAGPSNRSDSYRIQLQALKIDLDGQVLAAKTFSTNIANFGYPYGYMVWQYPPGNLTLGQHYNDLLVSSIESNWEKDANNVMSSIFDANTYLVIDTVNMTLKQPFWIKADKFKRAAYNEMPSIGLHTWLYYSGNSGMSYTPKAWTANGGFNSVNTTLANWASVSGTANGYTEGDLNATLAEDYNSINLTSWGYKPFDTTTLSDWGYNIEGNTRSLSKSAWGVSWSRYVGNRDSTTLYQLPALSGTSGCNTINSGVSGGYDWMTGDCTRFQGYFGLNGNGVLQVADINSGIYDQWDIYWFSNPAASNYDYGKSTAELSLQKRGGSQGYDALSLDVDSNWQHPGCTVPKSVSLPTIQVATLDEVASVVKLTTPTASTLTHSSTSGIGTLTKMPKYRRAPVLCSDYKVSLNQTFTMIGNYSYTNSQGGTSTTSSYITPSLDTHYTWALKTAPSHGSYDPANNRYTPSLGFVGSDSFVLTIGDGTGTQDVTITVMALSYNS